MAAESKSSDQRSLPPDLYKNTTTLLSSGILGLYEQPLKNVQKHLNEITIKQEALHTEIHGQNLKLAEVTHDDDLKHLMNKTGICVNKLNNIKKDMRYLHEKSVKLRKRALRLQQICKDKEIQRDINLKKEEDLIAGSKVSPS